MAKIKLITDSGSDITPELLASVDADLIPLPITIGDSEYLDFYELNRLEYIDVLRTCTTIPNSGQPSPGTFVNYFEKYMDEYDHVLFITMSVGGSGTYNSAMLGKTMFEEAHPDAKCSIHIHDSWSCSLVQVMQLQKSREMIDNGATIEEILTEIEALKRRTTTFYLVYDAACLIKGGRVSNIKGSVLSAFNIKPIIGIVNGWGTNSAIAIGFKNGISKIVKVFDRDAKEGAMAYITHCDNTENAQLLMDAISAKRPGTQFTVVPSMATMATQIGPEGLGLFFERTNP